VQDLWQVKFPISNPRKECSPLIGGKVVWLFVDVLGVAEKDAVCEQCYFYTPTGS
jgi:hypothetical protein